MAVNRKAAIKKALKGLDLGDEAICGFADEVDVSYECLPTPFIQVNKMTGGFARGKITIISGPPGTAKSTLVLQFMAKNLNDNPSWNALWVDAENAWDPMWAATLGVPIDRVIIIQKLESLEAYLNAFNAVIDTHCVEIAVIDSIGSTAPIGEMQTKGGQARDLKDDNVALQARKYSQWSRAAVPKISRANCAVVLIAQVYQDINSYGSLLAVKGGNALKHATYLRLMTRRSKEKKTISVTMTDGTKKEVEIGWNCHLKIDKTKQNANEGYEAVLPFRRNVGIMAEEAAIIAAVRFGLIKRKGAWFTYGEQRWQGQQAVVDFFLNDVPAFEELSAHLNRLVDDPEAILEPDTDDSESEPVTITL